MTALALVLIGIACIVVGLMAAGPWIALKWVRDLTETKEAGSSMKPPSVTNRSRA